MTQINRAKIQISNQLQKFRNLFDNDKIEILFKQSKKNHVIDLNDNQKSSFMFLYNLSQTKLTKFRRYFDNILIKN